MPGWKRVLTVLLIVFGPGAIIYYLAKNLTNKFITLPYIGTTYQYDADSSVVDSTIHVVPDFELTKFDGSKITRDSIKGKFIVLTGIQQTCPELDSCGMAMYLFDEIFYSKMAKNQGNYGNVKIISVLTDFEGNPISEGPCQKLVEEVQEYDDNIWWMTYGDPTPLFSFEYYGKNFMDHASDKATGEIGPNAFINSLVLIDQEGHVRGVSGAKRDTDIRNFFDMLKLLKKEDFDKQLEEKKQKENS